MIWVKSARRYVLIAKRYMLGAHTAFYARIAEKSEQRQRQLRENAVKK